MRKSEEDKVGIETLKSRGGNSLVLPYGVGIVGMVGNELGKTPRLPILSQLDTSYHILQLF